MSEYNNFKYVPSEDIINEIKQAIKCFKCKGNLTDYGSTRYNICIKMCKEAGVEDPTTNDAVRMLNTFNIYAMEELENYLKEKYHGISSEQGSKSSCS